MYSTGAISMYDRGTNAWRSARVWPQIRELDGVLVDLPGKCHARWPRFRAWDERAAASHARHLERLARRSHGRNPILFVFHPKFAEYARLLPGSELVYHAFDTFSGLPGWNADMAEGEREIVDRARVIFATSEGIGRQLPGNGPDRYVLLENGADVTAFADGPRRPCPPELAAIPSPRVGYVGRITAKLDFALMAELAAATPDWNWVLVGPVVTPRDRSSTMIDLCAHGIARLESMRNVHFLGERDPRDLPQYTAHMDVNTLCYRLDGGWWVDCYPLKLHEYLATGVPVVSSPIAVVTKFSSVVEIATSKEEWLSALTRAVMHGGVGTPSSRIATAGENSWEHRTDVLERSLADLGAGHAG
jgi:glycosyltransferase involved in cell wall biosynthesis